MSTPGQIIPSDEAGTLILEEVPADHIPPEGIDPSLWKQWMNEAELKKDQFLWQLKRGMDGKNLGLGNGLKLVNRYIHGTHKARYYLIGAESGGGKTTVGDFMYVINAWLEAKRTGRKLKIFYLSFEIGKTDKLFRWASYFIFLKYGIRLPSDYLQGKITGRLVTPEHARMTIEAYSLITEMLQDVKIVQDTIHPTKVFEDLIETHFSKNGTVHRAEVSAEDKKKGKKGYVTGYDEHDPELMTMLVIDHLALTGTEMHLETKGIMDKMSKYMIVLRNLFNCTGVFYQQFSTEMMASYRAMAGKKTEAVIAPQRLDFGDSKATFRDADVVFGQVKPQGNMNNFLGFDLNRQTGLGDCFVAQYLMKNRYGPFNRIIPLFMDGATGMIYDLPTNPHDKSLMEDWYQKAQQIEALCQVFSPQDPVPQQE